MKNLIKFLIVLLAFQINAQTPLPSGARFPNATEKSLPESKGFLMVDENNVANGFLDKNTFYTKPEVDDKFTLSPESFNIIKSDTGLPIFTPTPGQWNEVIREIGNTIRDLNGDLIFIYSGHISPYNATNTPFLGALKSTDDGETWTDLGKITGQGFEDGYIIIHNGQYFIYSEKKVGAASGGINLHYGTDLMNLTDYGIAIPNGTIAGTWDELDRTSPTAFTEDGKVKMLFEGRSYGAGGNSGGAVGYAESNDGFNFTINPDPIIVGYLYASTVNPAPNALRLNWASHIVPDGLLKLDGNYYLTSHAYNGSRFALALTVSKKIDSGWVDNIGTWIGLGEIESDNNGNGTSMFSIGSRLYANYEQNGSVYMGRFSVKVGSKGWYKTSVSATYEITPNNRNEHIDFTNANASLIYSFAADDKSGVGIVKKLRNLTINPINIQPKAGVLVDGSNAQFSIPIGEIVEMVSTGVNQWVIFSRSQIIDEKFNPIAGANVTITGTYPNLTFNASGGGGGGSYTGSTSVVLNGTSFERAGLTGDVTASQNSNATTISNGAVTNAKMANMAANTFKGRISSTGSPVDLTASQMNSALGTLTLNNDSGNLTSVYGSLDANLQSTTNKIYVTTGTNIPGTGGFLDTDNHTTTTGYQFYKRPALEDAVFYRNKTGGSWSATWYQVASREWTNSQLSLKANDNAVVKLTGNQTITGTKTYSSSPIVPDATSSTQAVNKGQLDAGYARLTAENTFTQKQNFGERITVDDIVEMEQSSAYTYGFSLSEEASIQATNSGFAFGVTTGLNQRKSFQIMLQNLTPNAANNIVIPLIGSGSGGNTTMVTTQTLNGLVETYLKALPSYNASTSQVLGHDASGNIQWVAP